MGEGRLAPKEYQTPGRWGLRLRQCGVGRRRVPSQYLLCNCGQRQKSPKGILLRELTPTKPGVQLGAEGNCAPGLCPSKKCLHNLNCVSIQWLELLRTAYPGADRIL